MRHLLSITTLLLLLVITTSCSSVRVASDYDKQADFNNYKTFAFYKTGIDKAEINDIDKRRILRAIEAELTAKGFTKSEKPDLLVSIFTKSREEVNVYNNGYGPYGYGWGWRPYYWNNSTVTRNTEGVLYIDLIDASKKELVWQGQGTGYLSQNKKEERIQEFVTKILEKYPPGAKK
ncbi:DUF4136 domain-containing protein [Oceanihabitans sediminis]|uniref:DUF4136 domain-containing protein n=1 Tax=Oceanihabitans sediminis TaxID=1812012 RepID=A0A368P4S7_9FLAO|nr:DUF4136 domain-containing protein [Oceanihabitans sediminis]MDX1278966.1 DUF4136 domain-containing protein [Oceanihabitans sediminis]MDX1772490.1 DUF4136 domain-containing protein [Oceanihabitans sediminis]RBP34139.1 uncharacterized protein DUF4136 [Oceanihabitans sediminis]RCU57832.1 DUF4136 domain-containing protein [Oceanihabitans sediminis]